MVDQDAPHEARGQRKEMCAILQGDVGMDEAQERFVHDRRRLQGVAAALGAHEVTGEAAQFVIHEGGQTFQRLRMTRTPLGEQLREICRHLHRRIFSHNRSAALPPGTRAGSRENCRSAA